MLIAVLLGAAVLLAILYPIAVVAWRDEVSPDEGGPSMKPLDRSSVIILAFWRGMICAGIVCVFAILVWEALCLPC